MRSCYEILVLNIWKVTNSRIDQNEKKNIFPIEWMFTFLRHLWFQIKYILLRIHGFILKTACKLFNLSRY